MVKTHNFWRKSDTKRKNNILKDFVPTITNMGYKDDSTLACYFHQTSITYTVTHAEIF